MGLGLWQRYILPLCFLSHGKSTDSWGWACGSGTHSLCVFFDMEHLLTGGVFHDKENTEGGCTAATSPAPPVSRCSMSKKTQRECVPLPQAQPQLSVDFPCERKHRGRMYRCHKPSPTCQQMFHDKENTEGGCTAATSPAPPVSRCSMSKKTQRECVPLPQAQPPTVSRFSM